MLPTRNARTGVVVCSDGNRPDAPVCYASLERSDDLDLHIELVRASRDHDHALALNRGMARVLACGCEFVWLLDADVVIPPPALTRLRAHLSAFPDCGIVGSRVVAQMPAPEIWTDSVAPRSIDVDVVSAASMLVRRSMIDDIGLLPLQDGPLGGIARWCRVAQRAGWRVMLDQSATVALSQRLATS
ncbi:MAG TPA: glycosyltransferase [Aeromicrobium sp.]|nr:glycosyltransferase [Aeromicrobium sp.]